jgi:hypothetical protein
MSFAAHLFLACILGWVLASIVYGVGAFFRWVNAPPTPAPPNERDWMQDFTAWVIK